MTVADTGTENTQVHTYSNPFDPANIAAEMQAFAAEEGLSDEEVKRNLAALGLSQDDDEYVDDAPKTGETIENGKASEETKTEKKPKTEVTIPGETPDDGEEDAKETEEGGSDAPPEDASEAAAVAKEAKRLNLDVSDPNVYKALKAYVNLNSLTQRQAQELGQLRKQTNTSEQGQPNNGQNGQPQEGEIPPLVLGQTPQAQRFDEKSGLPLDEYGLVVLDANYWIQRKNEWIDFYQKGDESTGEPYGDREDAIVRWEEERQAWRDKYDSEKSSARERVAIADQAEISTLESAQVKKAEEVLDRCKTEYFAPFMAEDAAESATMELYRMGSYLAQQAYKNGQITRKQMAHPDMVQIVMSEAVKTMMNRGDFGLFMQKHVAAAQQKQQGEAGGGSTKPPATTVTNGVPPVSRQGAGGSNTATPPKSGGATRIKITEQHRKLAKALKTTPENIARDMAEGADENGV